MRRSSIIVPLCLSFLACESPESLAAVDDQFRDIGCGVVTNTQITVGARSSGSDPYTTKTSLGPPPTSRQVLLEDSTSSVRARAREWQAGVEISVANDDIYRPEGYGDVVDSTIDLSGCVSPNVVLTFRVDALIDSTDTPGPFRQSVGEIGAHIEVEHPGGVTYLDGEARSMNESYNHYTTGQGLFTGILEGVPFLNIVEVPITVDPQDPTVTLRVHTSALGGALSSGAATANTLVSLIDVDSELISVLTSGPGCPPRPGEPVLQFDCLDAQ